MNEQIGSGSENGIPKELDLAIGSQRTRLVMVGSREQSFLTIREDEPTVEKIKSQAKNLLTYQSWWLTDWVETLGDLKEKWELIIGENQTINIYNFFRPLSESETDQIKKVFHIAQTYLADYIDKIEDIVISPVQLNNDKSGQPMNGNWLHTDPHRAMALYPAIFEQKPWRVSEATSSFSGILMHELGHTLATGTRNEWAKEFNWRGVSIEEGERKIHPGGGIIYEICEEPERCVTDYAKSDAYEDLAESFSAYVFDPDILDPRRLEFFKRKLPQNKGNEKSVEIQLSSQDEAKLPKLPDRTTYTIAPQLVHVITKVD